MLTIRKRYEHFWDRLLWDPHALGNSLKMDTTRWKDIPQEEEAHLCGSPCPSATLAII